MRLSKISLLACVGIIAFSGTSYAQSTGAAIATEGMNQVEKTESSRSSSKSTHEILIGAGSAGLNVGYAYKYAKNSHWRFRLDYLQLNESMVDEIFDEDTRTFEVDGQDVTVGGEVEFMGALIDFYPFKSFFRLTAGAYKSDVLFDGTTVYADGGSVEIDGTTYTVVDNVTANADIEWDVVAPYAGIGFDFYPLSWLGINFDIGAFYIGDPDINLTYNGTVDDGGTIDINDIPELDAEIQKELADWEDELSDANIYPQVRLGVGVRF